MIPGDARPGLLPPGLSLARAAGPGRAALRELPAIAALVLAALLLHHDALLFGRYFAESDTLLYYEPLTRWLSAELASGHLPLWLPRIFGGYPLLADGEMGLLYPPHLVAILLLSPAAAMVALRVAHSIFAALSTYALARALGTGPAGAMAAGAIFAFGSFNVAQMHHENVVRTAAWLPLTLLLAELACRASGAARRRLVAGCALALGMSALGLHVQPFLMALLVLVAFVTYRVLTAPGGGVLRLGRSLPGRLWQAAWMLAAMIGLGIGLAGAQWLPLFELSRTTFRAGRVAYDFATAFALPPANLIEVLFPYFFRDADGAWWTLWDWWETHLYVGVPGLLLALAGAALARRRAALFFTALALVALLLAMADQAPFNLHLLLWQVPGLDALRAPGRYSEVVVLAAAILAGYGLDAIARGERPLLVRRLGVAAAGLAVALAALFALAHALGALFPGSLLAVCQAAYVALRHQHPDLSAEQVARGFLWSTLLLNPRTAWSLLLLAASGGLILARPRLAHPGLWGGLMATLVTLDLLVFAYDLHPRLAFAEMDPPADAVAALASGPARVLTDPLAGPVAPDRLVPLGLDDASGYASLESQRHFDYWSAATGSPGALVDLWGVRTLAVAPDGPLARALAASAPRDPGHFTPAGRVGGVAVFHDARALPRAFVVGRPLYRGSRAEPTALARMLQPDFDPRHDVTLEEGPTPPAEPIQSARFAPASLRRVGTDAMEARATLDAPGYLVVTESYHRGWQAWVDGQPATVYLADFLFLAVPLGAGEHVVEFRFAPLSLWLGGAVSVAALLGLLGLVVGRPRLADIGWLLGRLRRARAAS